VASGGKVSCVLYEQDGVFIHPSCGKNDDQDNFISGVLRVIEKENEVIVDWRPQDDTLDTSNILCAGKVCSLVMNSPSCSKVSVSESC
uniref:Small G protein signalling modulator 1/2 Rab-binding domain-containing protein n=1 Tax=Pavo cristatus TaxID=9049 RepID=A0A8C9G8M2_PAVCR